MPAFSPAWNKNSRGGRASFLNQDSNKIYKMGRIGHCSISWTRILIRFTRLARLGTASFSSTAKNPANLENLAANPGSEDLQDGQDFLAAHCRGAIYRALIWQCSR